MDAGCLDALRELDFDRVCATSSLAVQAAFDASEDLMQSDIEAFCNKNCRHLVTNMVMACECSEVSLCV